MPTRLLLITICLSGFSTLLQAQSSYKITEWRYRQQFGGYDTSSSKARPGLYIIEKLNERGQVISSIKYNGDNSIMEHKEYRMNEAGYQQTELDYGYAPQAGVIWLAKEFAYNDKGLLQTAKWRSRYNKEGDTADYLETYAYDTARRLIQKVKIAEMAWGTKITETWAYSYKSLPDGYEMKTVYNYNGRRRKISTKTLFNSHGDMIREQTGPKISTNTYQYNDKGEWVVKKTCLRDGSLMPWVCTGEWRRVKLP